MESVYRVFLSLIIFVFPVKLSAHDFAAGLDTSEWHLEPSALQCKLWQPIPQFGMAVFEVNSGEVMSFYLESDRPTAKKGVAKLTIETPSWRPGVRGHAVGEVESKAGKRPVVIASAKANQMIDELLAGMMPTLHINGWTDNHPVEVGVSGVNFQDAYNGMLSCMATLFPKNFDQLQYSYLLFDSNKYGVKGWTRERLDLIAGYVDIDPQVSHVYIHGHTDNIGRKGHNWELSRLRANEVKEYLIKMGVDPSMITMQYHGEGKPRVKNSTKPNRAKNRRVYVRLKRTT